MSTQNMAKNFKKRKNQKYKNKNKMCRGGGPIFTICSLTHCHSWNNLPCIHNSSPSSPPATNHLLQPSLSSPTPPQPQ